MSKAILIIDMPENCYECPLDYDALNGCTAYDRVDNPVQQEPQSFEHRPTWCPLKPYKEAIPIDWIYDYIEHMTNIFGPMDISTMVRKYKEGFKPDVPEKGGVRQ